MKRFSILTLVLVITLVISACGAEATTPTVDAVAIQNTSAAVAFTMIAETQSAIPTATPTATFTNTPPSTSTLPPMPTLGATFTPLPGGNSGGGDPCINSVLPASLQGKTVKIRVNNSTKATLTLSVYLNQTTPQNVCGYRTYTLAPQESIVINNMVEGCFTLWAWNPDPEDYFIVTNGAASCLNESGTWAFDISTGSIKLR